MSQDTRGRMATAFAGALIALVSFAKRLFGQGAITRRLRWLYRALIVRLVARTGLFDAGYYVECNQDVVRAGWDPLVHYVHAGDGEGRQPMPLFDPAYYRAQLGGATPLNCLLHYAWIGRGRGVSPSAWFNIPFYLGNNPDVAASGIDPLQHYLRDGGLEGRSPCPAFDGLYYLKTNPDVASARVNPLLHFLSVGRTEGRRPLPPADMAQEAEAPPAAQPLLPGEDEWSAVTPRADHAGAIVDVIIPVYRGRIETLRCIHSALATTGDTDFAVIVIDDASPEPELSADLTRLAAQGLFTLLVNEQNRGFVRSVNRGMEQHDDRDVVLLNADAEVHGNWLDRLRACALRTPNTATVTPLSNNATICSYPRSLQDNPYPLEISHAETDALAAEVNRGIDVDAPTGVGFCMYIRRACLDQVGLFDEDAFGRGYGEENDFCQRAIGRGWRNALAADVYVRHWGSTSFRGETAKRVRAALEIVEKRHPGYGARVGAFIAADPLRAAREALDWARFRRQVREHNVLIVCHARGGGTERHVQEDVQRLQREGRGVFLLRPLLGNLNAVVLTHPTVKAVPNLPAFPLDDPAALERACRALSIDGIHTHSFVDFGAGAASAVRALAAALGARLELKVHDYEMICPRINLADEHGRYCGEPNEAGCNRCLAVRGSEFAVTEIADWRRRYQPILASANQVAVPDADVAQRLSRYFPDVAFSVQPHEAPLAQLPALRLLAPARGEALRVVVPGAISRFKGYDILQRCALDAQRRKLPLEFVLMGYSADDVALQKSGVKITGRYQEADAARNLEAQAAHAVWLPSTWPETYSYTLSLALAAGFPVFAFDLGAIASRLKAAGRGMHLMPLAGMTDPADVNDRFMEFRSQLQSPAAHAAAGAAATHLRLEAGER
jgi:GT2 family glycosyltransferase/glycosyltransferase involved in cell wall biosynthesis